MNRFVNKNLLQRLVILLLLIFSFSAFSKKDSNKTVLYISSFTIDNHWSEMCKEAMLKTFEKNGYKINLKEIYLDEKKSPELEERIAKLQNFFKNNKEKIDIIMAYDYGATDLLLNYSDENIKNIPIAFVSELEEDRKIKYKNITGIISDYGIGQVYKTGLKIFPNTRKVYVWADKSPTGLFFMNKAKNILSGYNGEGVEILYGVDANSDKELINKISSLDSRSFMIFGTWQVDDNGKQYLANDLYPKLIQNSNLPIFTVFDGFIGSGFAGGYVQLAEKNSIALTQRAIRIFNGEIPEKMNIENVPPTPFYDIENIIEHKGNFRVLPENSLILNQFSAFIKAHKVLATLLLIIIVAILSLLLLRIRNISLIKKMKKDEEIKKELELNIKLLSFAVPSMQIITWKFSEKEGKFLIGITDETGNKHYSEFDDLSKIIDYIDPIQRKEFTRYFQSLLKVERHFEFNYQYKAKLKIDDDYTWWEARGILDFETGKKGSYRIIYGILFNIEKFKENEAKLNQALERALQSDRIKSNFIANISHEIRTPLNAITGFSNLIVNTQDKEEQKEYKDIIIQNNELLLNLVNDILSLSEIDSGYIKIENIKIDLYQLMEELYGKYSGRQKPGVELVLENPYKSCIVSIDKNKTMRIIGELIKNSIKFTSSGSISIGYKIEEKDILFYVKDTGKGICKENLEKIFNRFEKLGSLEQGSGLGLSICKSLVSIMGGDCEIDSNEGEGTYSWVRIKTETVIIDNDKIKDTSIEADYN